MGQSDGDSLELVQGSLSPTSHGAWGQCCAAAASKPPHACPAPAPATISVVAPLSWAAVTSSAAAGPGLLAGTFPGRAGGTGLWHGSTGMAAGGDLLLTCQDGKKRCPNVDKGSPGEFLSLHFKACSHREPVNCKHIRQKSS